MMLDIIVQDFRLVTTPYNTEVDILLFFKHYDPRKKSFSSYVGRLFVKSAGKPIEILSKLNKMAGYALNEEFNLYEEIKFEPSVMVNRLTRKSCSELASLRMVTICFQNSVPVEGTNQYRYPDVPSFLEYVHDRQVHSLRPLYLQLSRRCAYPNHSHWMRSVKQILIFPKGNNADPLSVLLTQQVYPMGGVNIQSEEINHRYKFPVPRDLDRDLGKYLSPETDSSVRNLYLLHRPITINIYTVSSVLSSSFNALIIDRKRLLEILAYQCNFSDSGCGPSVKTITTVQTDH
ncbi:hypothetical protein V6N12_041299 [Hibiscus sabdariffa]|uniref:Ubiquitin carboxyl-terminal hydrolase 7 ICP0-binding domain-containing protein n=1 Tax=Hibiscus sabdariffa TaxID=183260 RepID=A0ABR2E6B3_9ROSI